MPFSVLVGCQWGDEGKGKIVDRLSGDADWVVRFQGGANAGHTVYLGQQRAVLHLVPTGMLRAGVRCAIGNGTVIDPLELRDELTVIEGLGFEWRGRLAISALAHVVTPLHKARETLRRQDKRIGTTGRGIGPAYEDKAARVGLRGEDLLGAKHFRQKLRALWENFRADLSEKQMAAAREAGCPELLCEDFNGLADALEPARAYLAPHVADVTDLLLDADQKGERILCEGAQGTWLDIDHGTYPYVTSSNTSIGGVCTGLGIPPQRIERVIGVVKSYCTRVGLGPFPTEFSGPDAERFREQAGEYGATTGRPRRCGWFDALLTQRGARVNGLTELVVTKLDVLSGLPTIKMATAYEWMQAKGEEPAARWFTSLGLEGVRPVYRDFVGWEGDLTRLTAYENLPAEARTYLEALADEVGVPLSLVSIGPGRDQVLQVKA